MSRKPDKKLTFDDVMSQMGVKPLGDRGGSKGGPKAPRKQKAGRAKAAKAAKDRGGGARPPASPARAPAPRPAPPVASPAPPPAPDPALAGQLAEARAAAQRHQDALAATRAHLEQVEARLAEAEAERAEVDAHRRSLQRALQEARGDRPDPTPPLDDVLDERGLKGDDERRYLFMALAESRQLAPLLRWLQPADVERVSQILDDRVSILGDCGACPAAPGRAIVRVPRARCEVCQGSDIRRAVRRFEDACLNLGRTKVTLVGGSPKYHRQLKELVQHRRLSLELVPGNVRRTQKQADHDLAHRDVIVLWGGTLLDHSTSDLYKAEGSAQVLRVPHRGIGRMLELAADALLDGAD